MLAELGAALIECGRLTDAAQVLGEAERLAASANDERAASHVLVQQQLLRILHVDEDGTNEAARAIALVIPRFERYKDDLGLCRTRRLEGLYLLERGARRGGRRGVATRGRACSQWRGIGICTTRPSLGFRARSGSVRRPQAKAFVVATQSARRSARA